MQVASAKQSFAYAQTIGWLFRVTAKRYGSIGSDQEEITMKTTLTCPCGETIVGRDEDDLVERVRSHLRDRHPDHEYTREQILMMAY